MPATPNEIKAEITLELDSSLITPSTFVRGVRSFFGLLTSLTRTLAEKAEVKWNVLITPGSALIGVVPEGLDVDRGLVERIKKAMHSGLSTLEAGAIRPEYFPDEALRRAYELASLSLDGEGAVRVRVWVKREPTTLTPRTVANTNELLGYVAEDVGSIEGRLRVLTERGALHFIIYEPVWNREIRCYVNEDVLPKALTAFRKRVEVFGTIRYRRDGTPVSIQVTDLNEFPPEDQLPDYLSVRGILSDRQ